MPDFYTFKWLGFSGQGHPLLSREFADHKAYIKELSFTSQTEIIL